MTVLSLWPRRAKGLPPGQRELKQFPRFSDKPLRWAPKTGPVSLAISVEGDLIAKVEHSAWDEFERIDQTNDFHCVTTWSVRGLRWSGVRFVDVVRATVGNDLPPYLTASAADRQQAVFRTEDVLQPTVLQPTVLLATHLDGAPLDAKHGAPLRLVSPGQYGYKNVKHLVAIDFRHDEPASTIGPKEHLRARVAEEERHSSLPNWMLRVPYRLTVAPTALAAERGLRRSPDKTPA